MEKQRERKDIDINELNLQIDEVKTAKWATKEEILQMIDDGIMVPYYFIKEI